MSLRSRGLLGATIAFFALSSNAYAQGAPRACTATNPATVFNARMVGPLAATYAAGTQWILIADRDQFASDTEVATVIELRDEPSPGGGGTTSLSVRPLRAGEGHMAGPGIAATSSHVVAAFVRPDGELGVWMHPFTGNTDRSIAVDVPARPTRVVATSVGSRVLVGWSNDAGGAQYVWVDPASGTATSPSAPVNATVVLALATGGGSLLVRTSAGANGWVRATGAPRIGGVGALGPARPSNISSAEVAGRSMLAWADGATARLVPAVGPTGAGRGRVLGTATPMGSVTVGAATFGSLAAWPLGGALRVLPMSSTGASSGMPFEIAQETPANITIAADNDAGVVFWTSRDGAGGAVRMVRVMCR